MDLEELRCLTQVNGDYIDTRRIDPIYYNTEHDLSGFIEPALDVSLLASCEFCNRTFLPASLNKHKRGCYKSWLKVKERESKMSNGHEKGYQMAGYHGDKPIMTIEQMLAKRRQRRLNWRLRHEEFMRAVHAARDYAEAVANGNPLPPPPTPMTEPDLKQCPHCQRKFHEKSIDRHIIRCKEQSIRNQKERPNYQTMEAKRRLAVRLYYQPNSRPNSCLSMSNSEPPTSFSRPSSRQTDFEYGRNIESSNSYNVGRHSSFSVIERTDTKSKLPSSILNNINGPHDRRTPRHSFKDFRTSQNSIPTYEHLMSTPNISENFMNGRKSNLSQGLSRNSSRQSLLGISSEIDSLFRQRSDLQSLRSDNYLSRRNIKRSTSCISQIQPSSRNTSEKKPLDTSSKNNIKVCNHKPFSCNRSTLNSFKTSKEISKSTCQINKLGDETPSLRNSFKDLKNRFSNKSLEAIPANIVSSRLSIDVEKSDKSSTTKHHSSRPHNGNREMKIDAHSKEVSTKIHVTRSKVSNTNKKQHHKVEETANIPNHTQSNGHVVHERPSNVLEKQQAHPRLKTSNSEINLNNLTLENMKSASTDNLKMVSKHESTTAVSGNRIRNEIQIRIKSHTQSDLINQSKEKEKESNKTIFTSISQNNCKESNDNKTHQSLHSDNIKPYSGFRLIDSKGEGPSPPQSSLRFVSNCNLSKTKEQAQGDSTLIFPKSQHTSTIEENKTAGIQPLNLYHCKSIKSVSIYEQNNSTKFKSSISLQDSLNRTEENQSKFIKSNDFGCFCHECGHKFPGLHAKFCCSCGSRRSESMMAQK